MEPIQPYGSVSSLLLWGMLEFAGGSRIQHPRRFTMRWAYQLCRVLLGLIRTLQHRLKRLGFLRAGDQEQDMPRRIEQWRRKSQARRRRLGHIHRHNQALLFME